MKEGAASGTATVCFTDLVGSTELLARLGEEDFDRLRRAHFAGLRAAVERAGGTEIKTLGDGILAVFGSAAQAVACAVAIQQTTGRGQLTASGPLAVRVGLALGDVVFEEGDVFGTPVVEAARLVAAAQGGQILASAVVRAVAGGRSDARFLDLGLVDLKGLPEPLAVCEVVWERLSESLWPVPPMLTDMGPVFVGRDADMERLSQLWKEAAAGGLRVALVAGEPGVGKTRLAAELARQVDVEGGSVLAGRCDEDLPVPYQPFVEALRHVVSQVPDEVLRDRLGRHAGELVLLVPELADRITDLAPPLRFDPETERYRLFEAVAAWLASTSAGQPVLLVLDDLQWAAKPTLMLLRHVSRAPEPMRLLVVGTYRDTELGLEHPLTELLPDLRRQVGVERISLSGLDQSGVVAYLQGQAGHDLTDDDLDLARSIHTETEGNPFFVREILRHLAETGALEQREGRWSARLPVEELGIPEGVREVVGRRLSRLSAAANGVLTVAAVTGAEFDLAIVRAAAGLEESGVLSALEEAIHARLVSEVARPVPRYRFAHALVRDTLYNGISGARRAVLHRQVAEAIEAAHGDRLDDHLSALAHHYGRAAAPAAEAGKAIGYAARAGDRALMQLAHDEAIAFYRQALELLDLTGAGDAAQRCGMLLSLGEAQRRAGDAAYRGTLLDAARRAATAGDAVALAGAALANTRGGLYPVGGRVDAERVAVLEDALVAVGPEDHAVRARLLATLGQELIWAGDRDRRVALSDEALAMARRLGDPATLAEVLSARYYTIASPVTREERWTNTSELLALAERLDDGATRSRTLGLRCRVALEMGEVEEAERCLAANERLSAAVHQPALRWVVALQRSGRTLLSGQLEAAERGMADALRAGEAAGQPDAGHLFLWQQVVLRYQQGRLGEMVETLTGTMEEYPALPALRAMLALSLWEAERPDECRVVWELLAQNDFANFLYDSIWLRGTTECAMVSAELGDTARAAMLHDLLVPYADHFPTLSLGTTTACVAHYLGRLDATLGRWPEAEAHFAAAADIHTRIGAPAWLADTRLEWGRMLLAGGEAGDEPRARQLLGQALAVARNLSMAGVERKAAMLLA